MATVRTTLEAKAAVIYQFACKGCKAKYIGGTGKTLKTRIKQLKAAMRNRYMSYLTTVHSLDTGHQLLDRPAAFFVAGSSETHSMPSSLWVIHANVLLYKFND